MQGQRVEAKRRNRGRGGTSWFLVLFALILGLAIGYTAAYYTVDVVNGTPGDLGPSSKDAWIDMTADSFAHNGDLAVAQRRLSLDRAENQFFSQEELSSLLADRIANANGKGDLAQVERLQRLAAALSIEPSSTSTPGEGAAAGGSETAGEAGGEAGGEAETGFSIAALMNHEMFWPSLMGCGSVFFLLMLGGIFLTRRKQNKGGTRPRTTSTRNQATQAPAPPPARSATQAPVPLPPAPAAAKKPLPPVEPARAGKINDSNDLLDKLFDETPKVAGARVKDKPFEIDFGQPAAPPVRYSPALDEFRTRYNYGDDGYDMSFSIETPKSEFLGECGVGISETLNKGTPQQATAFEVWLFDKDDIRTVTKVLLSQHAWNDKQLRNRLTPKGELIQVKDGETIDLETKSLRVRARIREAEYGTQGPDKKAYFERLVIELTPQQKHNKE
ncbi:MAG: hypothetical protein ACPGWR_29150 [Ardenticatenaceae bacterium]